MEPEGLYLEGHIAPFHGFVNTAFPPFPPWQLNALNLDNENRPVVVSQQYYLSNLSS